MAKSEEVFIYLKAVGAGETRRDIDNVARALDRLDKKTASNSKTLDEHSAAQTKNNAQTARANQLNSQRETTMSRVNKIQKDFNRLIGSSNQLDRKLMSANKNVISSTDKRSKVLENLERRSSMLSSKEITRAKRTQRELNSISERGWKREEWMVNKYAKRISLTKEKGFGGRGGRFGGGGGHILRRGALRGAGMGALIGTAIEGIPLLGTGLNAIGAAGLAAANGLAPLVGLLGALPAGVLALGSAGAVLGMAFKGFGAAIGGDAKELAKFGPNAQQFAKAITDAQKPMEGLRKGVQEAFMDGLGPEVRGLVKTYLPALHTHLKTIANDLNTAGRGFTGWLQSSDGKNTLTDIFANSEDSMARFSQAGNNLLQLFFRIGAAAGPMLTSMAEDFMNWTSGLNEMAKNDGGGLENFFNGSYDRFKEVLGVLGDFTMGIYALVSAADPLTSFLGDWISDVAKGFREWAESAEGQQDIGQYFEDMKEPFRAIVDLAGKLATGLFEISRSDNFVAFLDKLSGDGGLIDGLISIFKNADTSFLDAWIVFFAAIEKFVAEGGLKILGDIAMTIASAIKAMVDAWASLPAELQTAVLGLIVAGAVVSKVPGGGALGGALGGAAAGAGGGALAAAVPIAAGAGIATLGAGYLASEYEKNRTKGFGLDQKNVNIDVASGNWGSLFNGQASGTGPGSPTGLQGSLQRFSANKGISADINDTVEKSWIGQAWSNAFGSKTSWDIEKEKWEQVDIALQTLPLDQATTQFFRLKDQAMKAGVPLDVFNNELLPGFKAKFEDFSGSIKLFGTDFDLLLEAMGGGNAKMVELLNAWVNAQPPGIDPGTTAENYNRDDVGAGSIFREGNKLVSGAFFAGGLANAGMVGLAGEIGPEMAVGRNGAIGMLGLNGPELFKPRSDIGILPNSALHGGSTGKAPGWAVNALRKSDGEGHGGRLSVPQSKKNGTDAFAPINVEVNVHSPGADVDVIRAVTKAIRKAEQDRKERR